MKHFNENNELITVSQLTYEIENDNENAVTEGELEGLLEQYYSDALALDSQKFGFVAPDIAAFQGSGRSILDRIRDFVCGIINDGSTLEEIVEAILNAIGQIMPGGVIIVWIVKKIVKFIINKGVAWLCPAV